MARIAVVRIEDNLCVSLCVAEVTDHPYAGTFFVDVDNTPCDIGWIYDPIMNDFINPNPPEDGGV